MFPWGENIAFLRFAEALVGLCSWSSSSRGGGPWGFTPQESSSLSCPAPAPFASMHFSCSCSLALGWHLQSSFVEVWKCSEMRGTKWEWSPLSQSIGETEAETAAGCEYCCNHGKSHKLLSAA